VVFAKRRRIQYGCAAFLNKKNQKEKEKKLPKTKKEDNTKD